MPKRTINKSELVRKMGNIPAKAVVEKAKAQGIKLSLAHVYTIRSAANRKKAAAPARRGALDRSPKRAASHGLRSSIDRLAAEFVDEVMSAFRGASLDELLHP